MGGGLSPRRALSGALFSAGINRIRLGEKKELKSYFILSDSILGSSASALRRTPI